MAVFTTRVQRFFHLFFLSTTSEKSFIPYKVSAAVQALRVSPVWPRVLSSWGITLLEKLRAADESKKLETALSSSVKKINCSFI